MKQKIWLSISILLAFLLPIAANAAFDDVRQSDGSASLNLTDTGLSYVVDTGTRVQSFTVNTGSIDFTVLANSIISLRSPDKSGFTVAASGCDSPTITCGTDASRILIECGSGISAHTLTITPGAANTCTPNSVGSGTSGGSSGGGSGSSAPATSPRPTTSPAPTPRPTTSPTPTPTTSPVVTPYVTPNPPITPAKPVLTSKQANLFKNNLQRNSRSVEVKKLQEELQILGFLPKTVKPSTLFGKTTEQAIKDYQSANGLSPTGKLDVNTRSSLNALVPVPPATKATPKVVPDQVTFKSNLSSGSSGTQVKQLQQKLQTLGYFPQNLTANGSFGKTTVKALKDFQKASGLPQTGKLDVKTRALLNK